MAEENATTDSDGISEAELRVMIADTMDEKLTERGFTAEFMEKFSKLDLLDGLSDLGEKLKGSGDREGLLTEIGNLIDSKLTALGNSGGGKKDNGGRTPKLRIFG
jgi:hypothetical protein